MLFISLVLIAVVLTIMAFWYKNVAISIISASFYGKEFDDDFKELEDVYLARKKLRSHRRG